MRFFICAAVVVVLGAGCSSKRDRIKRDRDAGAGVVVVPVGGNGGAASPGVAGMPAPTRFDDEVEPNNKAGEANTVEVGAAIRGSLDGASDVDVYKFTLAKNSVVTAMVGGIAEVDLMVELLDSSGAVLAKSDRGPATTLEGFPNYFAKAGTYFLQLREYVKKQPKPPKLKKGQKAPPPPTGRLGPSPTYELSLWATPEAAMPDGTRVEREPNPELSTATEILLGEPWTGFVGWGGDVDVWKVSLEALTTRDGIDVAVAAVAGVGLTAKLLDAEGNLLAVRKGAKGAAVALTGIVALTTDGAPFAYVEVSGDRSNPLAPYAIRAEARALGVDDEAEPNDTDATAHAITGDDGVLHARMSAGDLDKFSVASTPEARELTMRIAGIDGCVATLTVTAGKQVLSTIKSSIAGGEVVVTVTVPAATTVIATVSVATPKSDPSVPRDYDLSYQLGPAPLALPEVPVDDEYADDKLDPMPDEMPREITPSESPRSTP